MAPTDDQAMIEHITELLTELGEGEVRSHPHSKKKTVPYHSTKNVLFCAICIKSMLMVGVNKKLVLVETGIAS